jgi:hypothetical protein
VSILADSNTSRDVRFPPRPVSGVDYPASTGEFLSWFSTDEGAVLRQGRSAAGRSRLGGLPRWAGGSGGVCFGFGFATSSW